MLRPETGTVPDLATAICDDGPRSALVATAACGGRWQCGLGEPTLAPEFDAIVAASRQGGAEVHLHTNGLGLTHGRCDQIVANGLHTVVVSIDGIESMQPIRGTSFEQVLAGVVALHEAKRRAESSTPALAIAFTMMRRNALELPRVVRSLVERVRIDTFRVQPLVIHYETMRDENPYRSEVAGEALEDARAIAEVAGAKLMVFRSISPEDERHHPVDPADQLGQHSSTLGCIDPFASIAIRSTGAIQACSSGLAPDLNVHDLPLDAIWNHEWYRALRRRLYSGEFSGPCSTCPLVRGGPQAQEAPLRQGVQHTQAARFFRGGYGRRQPRRIFDADYPFLGGS